MRRSCPGHAPGPRRRGTGLGPVPRRLRLRRDRSRREDGLGVLHRRRDGHDGLPPGRRRLRVHPRRRDHGPAGHLVGARSTVRSPRAMDLGLFQQPRPRGAHRGQDPRQSRPAPGQPAGPDPADHRLPLASHGVRHPRHRELAHDQHDDARFRRRARRHAARAPRPHGLGPGAVPGRPRLPEGRPRGRRRPPAPTWARPCPTTRPCPIRRLSAKR